jgi:maleate isomerase
MDFHVLRPEGVAIYVSRVPLQETTDAQEKLDVLKRMDESIPVAAHQLGNVEPNLVVFSCTTGSFLGGPGADRQIITEIKQQIDVEAVTTSTALVEAVRHLGIKRIDLLTPYNVEIGRMAACFLMEEVDGLVIENQHHMGVVGGVSKCRIPMAQVYKDARRVASCSSDALVIACTALQTLPVIDALELDLGRPVVTSNAATFWLAMRRLGIVEPYVGKGCRVDGLRCVE